jgi:hypothetical protein
VPSLGCTFVRKRIDCLLGLIHVHHQQAIATAPTSASRKSSTMPNNSTMPEPSLVQPRGPTHRRRAGQQFEADTKTLTAKSLPGGWDRHFAKIHQPGQPSHLKGCSRRAAAGFLDADLPLVRPLLLALPLPLTDAALARVEEERQPWSPLNPPWQNA